MSDEHLPRARSGHAQNLAFADPLRAVLMLLGVFLHAANVLASGDPWIMQSLSTDMLYTWIRDVIHFFRMPAFFFISGLLFTISMQRRAASEVTAHRLRRLLIPLAVCMVLINLPFHLLINDMAAYIPQIHRQPWTNIQYHLWFIEYLAIYIVIYGLCLAGRLRQVRAWMILPGLVAYYFLIQIIAGWTGIGFEELPLLGSPFNLFYYFGFFLTGTMALSLVSARRAQLSETVKVAVALALLCMVVTVTEHALVSTILWNIVQILTVYGCIFALILSFSALFHRPSRMVSALSEASYSIYLVHHPLIIVFAVLCIDWPLSMAGRYVFIVTATFLSSWAIHHYLVAPSSLASFLLNGRPLIRTYRRDSGFRAEKV